MGLSRWLRRAGLTMTLPLPDRMSNWRKPTDTRSWSQNHPRPGGSLDPCRTYLRETPMESRKKVFGRCWIGGKTTGGMRPGSWRANGLARRHRDNRVPGHKILVMDFKRLDALF